MIKDYALSIFI